MYYALVIFSTILFSFEFIFTNGYQKRNGSAWDASLKLSLYNGITSIVLAALISRFHIEVTLFSVVIAFIYACMSVLFSFVSIKALSYANLSVYSMLSMLGGMLLPFVYGILFRGEECSIQKIVSCVLIFGALYLTIDKKEEKKGVLKYYAGVFILNGMFGVLSTLHQSNTVHCVNSESFTIWIRFWVILICLCGLLWKKYPLKTDWKSVLYCVGGSSFNTVANLILLVALLHIQASVQYPMVTGGVILFSTFSGLLLGEDVKKKNILSAGIAFIAICLIVL